MRSKEFDGILFDLDGTLVDSMWIWKQIDIDFLAARGLPLPGDLQRAIEGMSFSETAVYFKERFHLKETLDEIKAEWHVASEHLYYKSTPLKAGVKEFLAAAKEKGLPMGIATSNSKELTRGLLSHLEIDEYFQTIRTSCEVPASKPAPDVYLLAAQDLGIIPERCMAFEDTLAGATAAYRANMAVYCIKDDHSLDNLPEIERIVHGVYEDFTEAIKLLK